MNWPLSDIYAVYSLQLQMNSCTNASKRIRHNVEIKKRGTLSGRCKATPSLVHSLAFEHMKGRQEVKINKVV